MTPAVNPGLNLHTPSDGRLSTSQDRVSVGRDLCLGFLISDESCLLVASNLIPLLSVKAAQDSEVPSDPLAEICRQGLGLPRLFQAGQPRSSHPPHGLPAEVCGWEPGYPTSVAQS